MTPVVYWERLMAGIAAILGTDCVWSASQQGRGNHPATYIELSPAGGPTQSSHERGSDGLPVDVTLTLSEDDGRAVIYATDAVWSADVVGGDVETARDALIAALAVEGSRIFATVTPVSTNALRIVPDDVYGLYRLGVAGPIAVTSRTDQVCAITSFEGPAGIQLRAYSTTPYPAGGAHDALAIALAQIEHRIEQLDALGLSYLRHTPPVDLSALRSARWETQAASTVYFQARSFYAEAIGEIDQLTGTLRTSSPTTSSVVTQEV